MASATGINVAIETKDPKSLAVALHEASPRIGIATGARGVAVDRLAALYVRPNESGLAQFLVDLVRQGPPPEEHPDQCSNCGRPHGGMKPLFIALDTTTGAGVVRSGLAPCVAIASSKCEADSIAASMSSRRQRAVERR
jgi:hypothetical protein